MRVQTKKEWVEEGWGPRRKPAKRDQRKEKREKEGWTDKRGNTTSREMERKAGGK
jgi:hypothetical protein